MVAPLLRILHILDSVSLMSKETTNNLKENDHFFNLKLRNQILRIGLHEFIRVKSEVNFVADRINLDDNLKTFWNKIYSSV